jgi:hypothetical protein
MLFAELASGALGWPCNFAGSVVEVLLVVVSSQYPSLQQELDLLETHVAQTIMPTK